MYSIHILYFVYICIYITTIKLSSLQIRFLQVSWSVQAQVGHLYKHSKSSLKKQRKGCKSLWMGGEL